MSSQSQPKPCTMEAFVAALMQNSSDHQVLATSLRAWLAGNWEKALRPLDADARYKLTREGGAE
ncbi:hypothetical protein [Martelella mediterranea]|uniref:Uncharacterized protein n=1 Tax=Martelella mediterranea TaxID=293089 RepID=A0A4R3NR17_9HYPH|nr:hypothetical protein [Martelella mediterranea]TCT34626.1 hypothetical protein EDC90_103320 [Martelella mediterranea]